jgi:hypothetical protein
MKPSGAMGPGGFAGHPIPLLFPTLLLALLALPGAALAQATGRLSGVVEDAGGKTISGARVTLLLREWAAVYSSTLSSGAGRFVFQALRPASYDLTVEAGSFATETLTNITVHPDAEISLPPIRLTPGNAGQMAPVRVFEQPLQTASVDVAAAVDGDMASRLPVSRQDSFYLLDTLPGVGRNGRSTLAIYGESASVAKITYDGVNIQATLPPENGLGPTTLPLRTGQIGEAAIVTGAIDGCGCSQTAFSTPAGSSRFHGSAYWLIVPPGLAAQRWLDNSGGTPAATNVNQIGATLGGPLRRNKLFFFVNYEAELDRSTMTRTGDAPSSPLSSLDPVLRQVLALIPSDPSGRYRGTQDNGRTLGTALARLDYQPSARHGLGATFSSWNGSMDDPSDSSVFGRKPTTSIGVSTTFFAAAWRWAPTNRLTNEVRVGANLSAIDYRNSLRSEFGFIAILDDPNVAVSQPMSGADPRGIDNRLYSYQDNLTWTAAKHSLRAGFWMQQYRLLSYGVDNGPLDSLSVPHYVVNDIAQGTISESDQRFNIVSPTSGYTRGTTARSDLTAHTFSGYFHEDWKLLRSLTINLGLRFDYLTPANELTGTAIIPVLSGDVSNAAYNKSLPFTFATSDQAFYRPDLDNYSPYMGLAWQPAARLPFVFRGGLSISYMNDNLLPNMSIYALQNPFQSFNVSTNLSGSPVPLSQAPATPAPMLPSSLTLPSLLALANSYNQEPGTVYGVDPNVRMPNVKYWNAGIESRVKRFLFDVRYLGNRLEEGPRSVDRNQVMLPANFLATFRQVQADLASGNPSSGFPLLPGNGLCANFSLQNCQPDLYARSLILAGAAGELARWYEGQGYNRNGAYNLLGNPLAPQGIDVLSHLGVSRYDALQLTVARPLANGLSLRASYVLSKVLSNLDDNRPGAVDPYLDLYNSSLEWAVAPFNVTHALKAAATYDLPFFGGRSAARSLYGKVLGGWSVSGIAIAQSGAPFSLLSGGSVATPAGALATLDGLGTFTSQADSGQNTVATSLSASQIESYFGIRKNPDGSVSYVNAPAGVFQQPAPGAVGNLQRRMFAGPGAFNLNLGLRKPVALTERVSAVFRAESINLLNNVNWLVGDQTYLGSNQQNSAAVFDNNVTQWNAPRTFQFSLRLLF